MCSTEVRLARLTEAIDDLAAAVANGGPPEALVERVADLWALVEAADPDIAARRTRYTDRT